MPTQGQLKTANLLNDGVKKEFQNQKALLREHLGDPDLPPIRGLPPASQKDITQRMQKQIELQRMKTVLEKENIVQPPMLRQTQNQPDGKPQR